MDTSRRVFIKFAAMLSAVAAAALGPGEVEAGAREATAPGSVTALLRHPDSARRIGEAYLRQHGNSALRKIEFGIVTDLASRNGTPREYLRDIRAQIRRDYDEGRTVDVDGWLLSKTEIALCVTAALRQHS